MIAGAASRRVASTGGVELAVAEAGDPARPTVLLIHGYPDTKEVWAETAARLARRFHVIAYDVRGAGASTAPAGTAAYDLERLEDDVLAVLDAAVPGKRVHLVGHDWGSVQGWQFATGPRVAGRLLSFTSISGPCLDHVGHWLRERLRRPGPGRLLAIAEQARRSWYIGALLVPGLAELAWPSFLGRRFRGLLERVEGLRTAGEAHPAATVARDGVHGAELYRRNVPSRLRNPRPDAFARVPVQLVVPEEDRFLSRRLYEDLDRWAPGLRRREVPAGHWVMRTHPDVVARLVAELVEDVESGSVEPERPRAGSTPSFAGRLVLVTGAGSGIGRATAIAFAEAGAEVLAVDLNAETAARTAELARLFGSRAHFLAADVSDAAAMEALARRVAAEHGVLDVLVNNAGIGIAGPFLDTTVEDWTRTLGVNLWGVIHGCRLFGRQMSERGQGGHIVNVASAAAFLPSSTLPAYGTSKAAVLMLTECLRAELAPRGIGVTAICPGFVATNITRTTRFVGRGGADERRLRDTASRLYGRRDFSPARVADEVLRAVAADAAVVPVTLEAKVSRFLGRFAPAPLRDALARLDVLPK